MLHTFRECQDTASLFESRLREGRIGNPNENIPKTFWGELNEMLGIQESGHGRFEYSGRRQIDPNYVSMKAIFEAFVDDGSSVVRTMDPRNGGRSALLESNDAINTSMFSNIIGQFAFSRVLERLQRAEFIGRSLVTTVPANTQASEMVPGIGLIGDVAEKVGEGQDYPQVGLTEEYVTVERKVKDGFIMPVTEEAVFEDKTGLLLRTLDSATDALGITWEKEILDTVLGITSRYSRNGGAVQATYGDTHTNGDFDNLVASNALVDQTDIEYALLAFDSMVDPNNGEPILMGGQIDIVVPTALLMTLGTILNGIQTIVGADSAANRVVVHGTSLKEFKKTFSTHSSQYVKNRTGSASSWFIGNFRVAFEYHEIWPIQKFTMDRNSAAGFSRDIVTAVKVRRKGVPAVIEPHKVVKCTQ